MKISMLMPAYNCPIELLERAVISVMGQTHKDFEIVIKDGNPARPACFSARFGKLANELGSKLKYIVSLDSRDDKKGRSGFYQALNVCMTEATGDVFSFLAGDDERGDADVLVVANERFEAYGSRPFLLYGDCERINKDGSHYSVVCPGSGQQVSNPVTFDELLRDNRLLTPAVFWNRAVFEKFGLFDESLDWVADYEYWLRIWRGIDKEYIPKSMGRYRIWEVSEQFKNCAQTGIQTQAFIGRYR